VCVCVCVSWHGNKETKPKTNKSVFSYDICCQRSTPCICPQHAAAAAINLYLLLPGQQQETCSSRFPAVDLYWVIEANGQMDTIPFYNSDAHQQFLAKVLLREYAIKSWFIFLPPLTNVSALPGKCCILLLTTIKKTRSNYHSVTAEPRFIISKSSQWLTILLALIKHAACGCCLFIQKHSMSPPSVWCM